MKSGLNPTTTGACEPEGLTTSEVNKAVLKWSSDCVRELGPIVTSGRLDVQSAR